MMGMKFCKCDMLNYENSNQQAMQQPKKKKLKYQEIT